MQFSYEEVLSFAKEYIKSENIPIEKVLTEGLRIDNPGQKSTRFENIRSIGIPSASFFVDSRFLCSDVIEFEWDENLVDLRIYTPDNLYFPDWKEYLYMEEKVKGYLSSKDWQEIHYKNNIKLEKDVLLCKIYMDEDNLMYASYGEATFSAFAMKASDGWVVALVSELMDILSKPIKDIYILNTHTASRIHRCEDGEYRVVLGGK